MPGSKKDPTERSKGWAMGRAHRQEARVRLQLPGEFNGSVGKKVRGSSDEGEMSKTKKGGGCGESKSERSEKWKEDDEGSEKWRGS